MEPNNGLTFAQEVFITIRQDGQLVAIEEQNGTIHRYMTSEATRSDSLKLLGADKVQQ